MKKQKVAKRIIDSGASSKTFLSFSWYHLNNFAFLIIFHPNYNCYERCYGPSVSYNEKVVVINNKHLRLVFRFLTNILLASVSLLR